MSFVVKLKGYFKPKAVEPDLVHPLFGNMMSEACGDEDDFWQSEIAFEPLNCEICINVLADSEGPNDRQSDFFKLFVKNYPGHFDFVAPALIKEYEDWFQEKLKGDFLTNFTFVGITIPRNGDKSKAWELSFDCLADKHGHMFTVEIEDGVITNVRADG